MAAMVDFKEGMKVRVMNYTLRGDPVKEGMATIVKINQGDCSGVYAEVRFDGESETVPRWIFAKFQEG